MCQRHQEMVYNPMNFQDELQIELRKVTDCYASLSHSNLGISESLKMNIVFTVNIYLALSSYLTKTLINLIVIKFSSFSQTLSFTLTA